MFNVYVPPTLNNVTQSYCLYVRLYVQIKFGNCRKEKKSPNHQVLLFPNRRYSYFNLFVRLKNICINLNSQMTFLIVY